MGARNEEATARLSRPRGASIFGMAVKIRSVADLVELKMDLMEDDVTADYPESRG